MNTLKKDKRTIQKLSLYAVIGLLCIMVVIAAPLSWDYLGPDQWQLYGHANLIKAHLSGYDDQTGTATGVDFELYGPWGLEQQHLGFVDYKIKRNDKGAITDVSDSYRNSFTFHDFAATGLKPHYGKLTIVDWTPYGGIPPTSSNALPFEWYYVYRYYPHTKNLDLVETYDGPTVAAAKQKKKRGDPPIHTTFQDKRPKKSDYSWSYNQWTSSETTSVNGITLPLKTTLYNVENELITTTTYTYDAEGKTLQTSMETTDAAGTLLGKRTETYTYHSSSIVDKIEIDDNGAVFTKDYIYDKKDPDQFATLIDIRDQTGKSIVGTLVHAEDLRLPQQDLRHLFLEFP